jgi:hypothetical protein
MKWGGAAYQITAMDGIMAKKEVEVKIVRRTESRQLKVNLSKDEIFDAGAKAADAQQKIMELDDELTTFKEQHKGKVAMAEADLNRNSTLVRQKYDFRKVECEIISNHTEKTIQVYRRDTDEQIENRPMTAMEASTLPI